MSGKKRGTLGTIIIAIIGIPFVLAIVAVIAQHSETKKAAPAEQQKVTAMAQRLEKAEKGDLVIVHSKPPQPRILYVKGFGEVGLRLVSRVGEHPMEYPFSTLSSSTEDIIKGGDEKRYPAMAKEFLQQ